MAATSARKMRPTSSKKIGKPGKSLEGRNFPLSIRIVETEEVFPLENVGLSTTIEELKSYLEFATGIPIFMQRLHYLDEGDLQDSTDVRSNDIVPGGCLHLNVWHTWSKLVVAAVHGDVDEVFRLGVTATSDFRTPNSQYMSTRTRQAWLQERAFVALYIASHRGHVTLVKKLIESGANVNGKTTLGRTPLHVAASQDRGDIVDILLNNGADVNALDNREESALDIAEKFGHKDGARHLFLFQWQVRAANAKKGPEAPLFLHQLCDTAFPIWHNGTQGQLYYANILPPGEFSGTGLGAKKRVTLSPIAAGLSQLEKDEGRYTPGGSELKQQDDSATAAMVGLKGKKVAFEEWLKKKQKVEQVRLDKVKAEEELKKLEEAKKKEQSLIDKESYETWVKKQQEEKSSQEKAEKKKAAKKVQQLHPGTQRHKGNAALGPSHLAASSSQLAELEAADANREVQELKRFIEKKWKMAAGQSGNNLTGLDDEGISGSRVDIDTAATVSTKTVAGGKKKLRS